MDAEANPEGETWAAFVIFDDEADPEAPGTVGSAGSALVPRVEVESVVEEPRSRFEAEALGTGLLVEEALASEVVDAESELVNEAAGLAAESEVVEEAAESDEVDETVESDVVAAVSAAVVEEVVESEAVAAESDVVEEVVESEVVAVASGATMLEDSGAGRSAVSSYMFNNMGPPQNSAAFPPQVM